MIADEASSVAQDIERGLHQCLAYLRGDRTGCRVHTYQLVFPNIRELRRGLGLSQRDFALEFGFAVSAVRAWERGKRVPNLAERILLTLIAKDVEAVREVIRETVRHVSTEQF
jgi:putative transcriptional regulator